MNSYKVFIRDNLLKWSSSLTYKDLMSTPFIYNLSHFVSNRNYFYNALDFYVKKYDIPMLSSIILELYEGINKWNSYKNLLLKSIMRNSDTILDRGDKLFYDITILESDIIEKFITWKGKFKYE